MVHFVHADDDFAIGGNGTCRQTGTATTGGEDDVVLIGKQDDGLYLFGGLWKDDGRGGWGEVFGPVFAPIFKAFWVGFDLGWVKLMACKQTV